MRDFLIISLALFVSSSALTVNKCCRENELLNVTVFAECVSNPMHTQWSLDWFPFTALFDLESGKPLDESGRRRVESWLSNDTIKTNVPFQEHGHLEYTHFNESYTKPYDFKIFVGNNPNNMQILLNVHKAFNETHNLDPAFMVPLKDVCFEQNTYNEWHAHFLDGKVLLHKCCGYGLMYDQLTGTCIKNLEDVQPNDWLPQYNVTEGEDLIDLGVPLWFDLCKEELHLSFSPDNYFCRGFHDHAPPKFYSNGSVRLAGSDKSKPFELHEANTFCSEVTVQPSGITKHNIIVCYPPSPDPESIWHEIYGALFLTGGFILLLTIAISLYLPQLRQRLHNRIIITHNASLMIAHFAWGPQFFTDNNTDSSGCSIKSLILQFTFLASIFWLNVFCINLSSTFRYSRILSSRSVKSDNRRYFIYSLYAWGVPAVISLFTIFMEFLENTPMGIPRPGFTCFCKYADGISQFIYLYGPMSIILMLNLVMYIATTWKIISVHRQTAPILKRMESSTTGGTAASNDHQKLALYTKLFLVMGVTWTLDIITWAADIGETYFSRFCDFLNILRPVFIFLIFICKKSVLVSLKQKIFGFQGKFEADRSTANTEAVSMGGIASRKESAHEDFMLTVRNRNEDIGSVQEILIKPIRN